MVDGIGVYLSECWMLVDVFLIRECDLGLFQGILENSRVLQVDQQIVLVVHASLVCYSHFIKIKIKSDINYDD